MSNSIALNSQLAGMGAAGLACAATEVADDFPLKWPFPPAPARGTPGGRRAPSGARPLRAPLQAGDGLAPERPKACSASHFAGVGQPLSRKAMVTDIFLVGVWGAMIPGLMWLGAALGF